MHCALQSNKITIKQLAEGADGSRSQCFPRMRASTESIADLKDTRICIERITKYLCNEKGSLIAFNKFLRKNKYTKI